MRKGIRARIENKQLGLTGRLHLDLYRGVRMAGLPFGHFKGHFDLLDSRERVRTEKYAEDLSKKLKSMGDTIDYRISEGLVDEDFGFNFNNISTLSSIYKRLQSNMPDGERVQEIIDLFEENLKKSRVAGVYGKVKKLLPLSALVSGFSAFGAATLGMPVTASIYSSSLVAAVKSGIEEKPHSWQVLWANLGIYLGFASMFVEDIVNDNHSGSGSHLTGMKTAIRISHVLALPMIIDTFDYIRRSKPAKVMIKHLKNSRAEVDDLIKHGIVIEEAQRNLRYVQKVIKREGKSIDHFQGQINNLERVLEKYLDGKVSYEKVLNARINYEQSQIQQTQNEERSVVSQKIPAKFKYTQEEHAKIRAEREEMRNGNRKSPLEHGVENIAVDENQNEPKMTINLSQKLNKDYKKGKQFVGGHGIKVLVDLTKSKIEANYGQGEVIRRTTDGRYLIERLASRHNLPQDVTVYKMQPVGALRALYVRDKDQITILEIMDHKEYDARMRKI